MDNQSSEEERRSMKTPGNCSNHHSDHCSDSELNDGDISENGGWENEQDREEAVSKLDKTFMELQQQSAGMKGRTKYLDRPNYSQNGISDVIKILKKQESTLSDLAGRIENLEKPRKKDGPSNSRSDTSSITAPSYSSLSLVAGSNIRDAIMASDASSTASKSRRSRKRLNDRDSSADSRFSHGRKHRREDRDFSESDRERKNKRRSSSFSPDFSPSKKLKSTSSCPVDRMKAFYTREKKMGPKVSREVADLINKGLGRPIQDEKIKEVCEKYCPPENVPNLRVPMLDKPIERKIRGFKKTQNDGLEFCQSLMVKTLTASTQLTDIVFKAAKGNIKVSSGEISEKITDITKLQSVAFNEINKMRKIIIRQSLPFSIKKLCDEEEVKYAEDENKESGEECKSTKWLLGGTVAEDIKKQLENNKVDKALDEREEKSKNGKGGRGYGDRDRPPFRPLNPKFTPRKEKDSYPRKQGKIYTQTFHNQTRKKQWLGKGGRQNTK